MKKRYWLEIYYCDFLVYLYSKAPKQTRYNRDFIYGPFESLKELRREIRVHAAISIAQIEGNARDALKLKAKHIAVRTAYTPK